MANRFDYRPIKDFAGVNKANADLANFLGGFRKKTTGEFVFDVGVEIASLTLGTPLETDSGGTGLATYAAGDMLYYASGTALSRLAKGADYTFMQGGTTPSWVASPIMANGNYLRGRNFGATTQYRLIGVTAANGVSIDADGRDSTFGGKVNASANAAYGRSNPAYSFDTDPDTGWYRYGADQMEISCGNTSVLYMSTSAAAFGAAITVTVGGAVAAGAAAGSYVLANTKWVLSDNSATNASRKLIRLSGTNVVELDGDALGATFGDSLKAASLVSFSKTLPSSQTIPAGYSCVVADVLTIPAGMVLTISSGASLAMVA